MVLRPHAFFIYISYGVFANAESPESTKKKRE